MATLKTASEFLEVIDRLKSALHHFEQNRTDVFNVNASFLYLDAHTQLYYQEDAVERRADESRVCSFSRADSVAQSLKRCNVRNETNATRMNECTAEQKLCGGLLLERNADCESFLVNLFPVPCSASPPQQLRAIALCAHDVPDNQTNLNSEWRWLVVALVLLVLAFAGILLLLLTLCKRGNRRFVCCMLKRTMARRANAQESESRVDPQEGIYETLQRSRDTSTSSTGMALYEELRLVRDNRNETFYGIQQENRDIDLGATEYEELHPIIDIARSHNYDQKSVAITGEPPEEPLYEELQTEIEQNQNITSSKKIRIFPMLQMLNCFRVNLARAGPQTSRALERDVSGEGQVHL